MNGNKTKWIQLLNNNSDVKHLPKYIPVNIVSVIMHMLKQYEASFYRMRPYLSQPRKLCESQGVFVCVTISKLT